MFMNALGQQVAAARGAPPARAASGLAQGCEVEACDGASPFSAWGSALGGLGSVQGNSNRARSPTISAAPRPASTIVSTRASSSASARATPRHAVGEQLLGPGLERQRQRRGLRQLHAGRLLRRRAGGLRLLQQPAAAPDPDPRPAAAHRQRQHRRQPVPRPGRDRLQVGVYAPARRPSRRSGGCRSRARPERLQRVGRQLAQPQRGAADDQLAAHDVGRRPRRRRSASATSASSTWRCGWAGCTSSPIPVGR